MKRVPLCSALALMLACGVSMAAQVKGPFLLVSRRYKTTTSS
jgi:hypothetical protein